MRNVSWLGLVILLVTGSGYALEPPANAPVLSVSGHIGVTNADAAALFDREMLAAMPQHTTRTHTPWHDGQVTFSGPLGRDVLAAVEAQGSMLRVTALNDYSADVPVSDFHDYDVILAMTLDGSPLRVRDQGPLFIIYPFDEKPELLTEKILTRSVWQVSQIHVLAE